MPQDKKEKYIAVLSFEDKPVPDIESIEVDTYEEAEKIAKSGMKFYEADSFKVITKK